MQSSLNLTSSTRIVLQGEFAIVDGNKSCETIKTTHAYTCTVFSLYNPARKIAVLAHFDDYTDVKASLKKIALIVEQRFGDVLNGHYTAKLVDGMDGDIVSSFFEKRSIQIRKLNLQKFGSYRPHLSIRPQDGATFAGEDTNFPLEYLQRREFGEFITQLERRFPGVSHQDLPYFPAKESTRYEEAIIRFPKSVRTMKKAIEWGIYLEQMAEKLFPIQMDRPDPEEPLEYNQDDLTV